jgi:undecaprenyl diphosphate synthase
MDGNGRWARERNQPRPVGHKEGARAVREVVTHTRRLGIDALTLYAFSEQNWARPEEEVSALMGLLQEYMISERETLLEQGVQLRAIGRIDRLSPQLQQLIDGVSEVTSKNSRMTLSLCLSYGGREEIADAAQALARKVKAGELEPEAINEDLLGQHIPSLDVGPVDLMIRTGGEQRISNFLLWPGAYAELYFSSKLWPDYGQADLYDAIHAFQQRNRRFGLAENVAGPGLAQNKDEKQAISS